LGGQGFLYIGCFEDMRLKVNHLLFGGSHGLKQEAVNYGEENSGKGNIKVKKQAKDNKNNRA
jgi:hypothetical protein